MATITYSPTVADLTDLFTVESFLELTPGADPNANLIQFFITALSAKITEALGHSVQYVSLADWASGTYQNGQLILPSANNPGAYSFRCISNGVTANSAPASWPQTVGQTVTDGTMSWANVGAGVNVSELRNGTGQQAMMLRQFPVNTLGSVEMFGVFQTPAVNDSVDGVLLEVKGTVQRGTVWLRGITSFPFYGPALMIRGVKSIRFNYGYGYWTPGQEALSIAQPAGVSALPYDLKEAATEIVGLRFRQRRNLGNVSTGEGPERITFFIKDLTDAAKSVIEKYKDVVPWN